MTCAVEHIYLLHLHLTNDRRQNIFIEGALMLAQPQKRHYSPPCFGTTRKLTPGIETMKINCTIHLEAALLRRCRTAQLSVSLLICPTKEGQGFQ